MNTKLKISNINTLLSIYKKRFITVYHINNQIRFRYKTIILDPRSFFESLYEVLCTYYKLIMKVQVAGNIWILSYLNFISVQICMAFTNKQNWVHEKSVTSKLAAIGHRNKRKTSTKRALGWKSYPPSIIHLKLFWVKNNLQWIPLERRFNSLTLPHLVVSPEQCLWQEFWHRHFLLLFTSNTYVFFIWIIGLCVLDCQSLNFASYVLILLQYYCRPTWQSFLFCLSIYLYLLLGYLDFEREEHHKQNLSPQLASYCLHYP